MACDCGEDCTYIEVQIEFNEAAEIFYGTEESLAAANKMLAQMNQGYWNGQWSDCGCGMMREAVVRSTLKEIDAQEAVVAERQCACDEAKKRMDTALKKSERQ